MAAIAGDFCFGIWLRYRPNREPMIGVIFVSILSPILFVFAEGIGGKMGLIVVLISRSLLGFTRGSVYENTDLFFIEKLQLEVIVVLKGVNSGGEPTILISTLGRWKDENFVAYCC